MNWTVKMDVVGNAGDRVEIQWRDCTAGTYAFTNLADISIAGGGVHRTGIWQSNGWRTWLGDNSIMWGTGPSLLHYIQGHVYEIRYRITALDTPSKVSLLIMRGW